MDNHFKTSLFITAGVLLLFFFRCGVHSKDTRYRTNGNRYDPDRPISIMGRRRATARQLVNFFFETNSKVKKSHINRIANIYIDEASREGVNSDIAFCQMCLETNYLRFGGSVKASQNNFCGLGATSSRTRGLTFPSVRIGIRAHIQHLKGYASNKRLRNDLVDPRFDRVKRASVTTVQNLSKTWATDPNYGLKIVQMLKDLNKYL